MSPNDRYRFITRWRVQAAAEDVFAILSEPVEYPRWWPSVYLAVREIGPDRVQVLTRGWLPYRLRWEVKKQASQAPSRIAERATGDFDGYGVWSIVQDGEFADITFDWQIRTKAPILRYLSFALRPVFEANHRWAMEQGLRSLELEIQRYRSTTVEEMNLIPAPPRAADLVRRDVFAGAVLTVAVIAGIWKAPH